MSPIILAALLGVASAAMSSAALVNIAANSLAGSPARNIISSLGDPLPVGSAIRIGTFPAGAPVITAASTFASVNALFVPLAESSSDPADGTTAPLEISSVQGAGKFAGTISNVDNGDTRFSAGTAIYIFALNAPYSNLSGATEWAIFRDSAWDIPTTATRTLTTSQIDVQSEMVVGVQGPASLRLVAIPEMSTTLLSISAMGLGLLRRRR